MLEAKTEKGTRMEFTKKGLTLTSRKPEQGEAKVDFADDATVADIERASDEAERRLVAAPGLSTMPDVDRAAVCVDVQERAMGPGGGFFGYGTNTDPANRQQGILNSVAIVIDDQ